MADSGVEASLNEGALKRVDPYIKEILDTAKYVALYKFENDMWAKTKIEGSLFVYARTAAPWYNILILNRLDKKNLIEPITPELDLQRNEPYLLYKNSADKIFGIWFFDRMECVRISFLVKNLMEKSVVKPAQIKNKGEVDIFQMLTKAQEAFTSKDAPVIQGKQSFGETSATPKSVADFFAKAGTGSSGNIDPAALSRPKTVSESELGILFQQLMANQVPTVEHIEKQQRVVTPLSTEFVGTSHPLKQFLRPRSMEIDRSNMVTCESPPYSNSMAIRRHELLPEPIAVNGTNGFIKNPTPSTPPGFPVIPSEEAKNPDLMPPAMFTPKESAVANEAFVVAAREPEMSARLPGGNSKVAATAEPLTRNQLFQALDYLLRNDPDFMTKIHEAYVKSLRDKIL